MDNSYIYVILTLLTVSNLVNSEWVYWGGNPDNSSGPSMRSAGNLWIQSDGTLSIYGGQYNGSLFGDFWTGTIDYSSNVTLWSSNATADNITITSPVFNASRWPGPVAYSSSWIDSNDCLYFFGGLGYDSGEIYRNDVWKFNGSFWMIENLRSPLSQVPVPRAGAASWCDRRSLCYIYGGLAANQTLLNDLWQYDFINKLWQQVIPQNNSALIVQYPNSTNQTGILGGRFLSSTWIDSNSTMWIYGGSQGSSLESLTSIYGDLWKFVLGTKQWIWMGGTDEVSQPHIAPIRPGASCGGASWVNKYGSLCLYGGWGMVSTNQTGYQSDVWCYDVRAMQWTFFFGRDGVNVSSEINPTNYIGGRYLPLSASDEFGNLFVYAGEAVYPYATRLWSYFQFPNETDVFVNRSVLARIVPAPTTAPTTPVPTTARPTTSIPLTAAPSTRSSTTVLPTTTMAHTAAPTTVIPTTIVPTTIAPTAVSTTSAPTTTVAPTTTPTTIAPTTMIPTTIAPSTVSPTTVSTTMRSTTQPPTTTISTTNGPTPPIATSIATTDVPTTSITTTVTPTTSMPTTMTSTTVGPTNERQSSTNSPAPVFVAPEMQTMIITSMAPTTQATTTNVPTTVWMTTVAPTSASCYGESYGSSCQSKKLLCGINNTCQNEMVMYNDNITLARNMSMTNSNIFVHGSMTLKSSLSLSNSSVFVSQDLIMSDQSSITIILSNSSSNVEPLIVSTGHTTLGGQLVISSMYDPNMETGGLLVVHSDLGISGSFDDIVVELPLGYAIDACNYYSAAPDPARSGTSFGVIVSLKSKCSGKSGFPAWAIGLIVGVVVVVMIIVSVIIMIQIRKQQKRRAMQMQNIRRLAAARASQGQALP